MNLLLVEYLLDISFIKIRFSCNQNIGDTLFYIEWKYLQLFEFWLKKNLILMKNMSKKCSKDQRFILRQITS